MQTPCARGPTRHHTPHPQHRMAACTLQGSHWSWLWCGWEVRPWHGRSGRGDRELLEGGRKWEPIAEFHPHITSNPAALPWWCQKSSAPLEKQPLTFVERRFSGLVGDVRLSPSLQQGEQTVQVAPAGGQVESRLLVEGALVDCAGVRCEETANPKSLWHVVHKCLQHHHLSRPWEF